MPITMKDIAKDLNVSIVTVSKVLRNHSDISPETRKRVLRRVKELGYQPNWAARSLVTGLSYTIGLVIPTMTHPFFAEIAKGISAKIRRKGYSLVISSSEEDPELEKMEIEHLLARQVDALIIASVQTSVESFHRIQQRKIPYVLIDRKFSGLSSNYVGADDEEIGRLATNHIIESGCCRIAHIRGPVLSTGLGRMEGYRNALAEHGLEINPSYIVWGKSYDDNGEESGYEAMQKLLALNPQPDAVVCFNDPIAIGAMQAIWEAGLQVPQNIALIGAGNLRFDEVLRVPLSSVDQGSITIGEKAANLALQLIKQRKSTARTQEILLPSRIVIRESSMKGAPMRVLRTARKRKLIAGNKQLNQRF
jgi:LacI family transcriptional regulator, galactose operon repressor